MVKMIYHTFNTHETPSRSQPLAAHHTWDLAYLSSLSLGGRAYSGLGWRRSGSICCIALLVRLTRVPSFSGVFAPDLP